MLFSDAVFAIAITLLVLELKVPVLAEGATEASLRHALLGLIPKYVGFVVSFALIGSMWVEHHRVFWHVESWDYGLAWRNLTLLFGVALLPFPTALFSEHYRLRTALSIYALNIALVGVAKIWLWRHAVAAGLVGKAVPREKVGEVSRRSWALPVASIGTALAAAVGVPFAYLGFVTIPLLARLFAAAAKKAPAKRGRPVA